MQWYLHLEGISCSDTWNTGYKLAEEYGYGGNLMGIQPDQSKFLGHSWP